MAEQTRQASIASRNITWDDAPVTPDKIPKLRVQPVGVLPESLKGRNITWDKPTTALSAQPRRAADQGYNVGGGLKTLGGSLLRLPEQVLSSTLSAIQGGGGADIVEPDWMDRIISVVGERQEKRMAEIRDEYGEQYVLPGIKITDVGELAGNLGFSGTSAIAGIGAAVPFMLIPEPTGATKVAGWAVGTTAAGAAAFNMAKYEITKRYLETMQEEKGSPLTLSEENQLKIDFDEKATKHGLWEAVPEAVGQATGLKIIATPIRGMFSKNIATRFLAKLTGIYGIETGTEIITEIGQSKALAGTPVGDKEPLKWDIKGVTESFKRVAPQVFLLTSVMGGAGAVGVHIYEKEDRKLSKALQGAVNEGKLYLLPSETFRNIVVNAKALAKKRPNDTKLQGALEGLENESRRRLDPSYVPHDQTKATKQAITKGIKSGDLDVDALKQHYAQDPVMSKWLAGQVVDSSAEVDLLGTKEDEPIELTDVVERGALSPVRKASGLEGVPVAEPSYFPEAETGPALGTSPQVPVVSDLEGQVATEEVEEPVIEQAVSPEIPEEPVLQGTEEVTAEPIIPEGLGTAVKVETDLTKAGDEIAGKFDNVRFDEGDQPGLSGYSWTNTDTGESFTTDNLNEDEVRAKVEAKAPEAGEVGKTDKVHDYSNTQVQLPKEAADSIKAFGKSIPDSEIYEELDDDSYGRETEPHITVRYGLETDNVKDIVPAFKGLGPIKAKLGKVSIFESDDYDVIKVDIESPDLETANKKVGETVNLPGETFKDYKPHTTIAYVKKGEGKKYVGDNTFEGKEVVFDKIQLSDRQGNFHDIKLEPAPAQPAKEVTPQPAPAKEPWEMSRGEFEESYLKGLSKKVALTGRARDAEDEVFDRTTADNIHIESVKQAQAEGKPVPPEVLAEYPELTKKPTVKESLPVAKAPTKPKDLSHLKKVFIQDTVTSKGAPVLDKKTKAPITAPADAFKTVTELDAKIERYYLLRECL